MHFYLGEEGGEDGVRLHPHRLQARPNELLGQEESNTAGGVCVLQRQDGGAIELRPPQLGRHLGSRPRTQYPTHTENALWSSLTRV